MTVPGLENPPTTNKQLLEWVEEMAALAKPDQVVWADGSDEEWHRLTEQMVEAGTFIRLNPEIRPELLPGPLGSRVTSRASRTAPSSARSVRSMPDRRTTGPSRPR